MNCEKCGTNKSLIIAPYVMDFNKFCIYRGDGVEVIFQIKNNMIFKPSAHLTPQEVNYIKNNII